MTAQSNRNIQAGSLAIKATFRDDVDTVVVAGSDPIARRDKAYIAMRTLGMENPMDAINKANIGTNTKNISADAAVAVAIVENEVKAELLSGGRLTTTATADTIETGILTGVDAVGTMCSKWRTSCCRRSMAATAIPAFRHCGRRPCCRRRGGGIYPDGERYPRGAGIRHRGERQRACVCGDGRYRRDECAGDVCWRRSGSHSPEVREGLNYVGFGAGKRAPSPTRLPARSTRPAPSSCKTNLIPPAQRSRRNLKNPFRSLRTCSRC